jgi:hypothetical protein
MPTGSQDKAHSSLYLKFCTTALFCICLCACDNGVVSEGNGEYSLSSDAAHGGESSGNIIERLKLKAQEYCKGKGGMEYLASTGGDSPGTPSATVYFTCKSNAPTKSK